MLQMARKNRMNVGSTFKAVLLSDWSLQPDFHEGELVNVTATLQECVPAPKIHNACQS